ncbi:putative DEAD/DEAH box RNA helicase [Phyllosticta capitalensis]
MSDTFDTTDMAAAIDNADSGANIDNVSEAGDKPAAVVPPPEIIALTEEELRAKGFVAREAYKYRSYTALTAEEQEQLRQSDDYEEPVWAANAVRYEWQGEFGEVGPANKELEEELFRHVNEVTKGTHWSALDLDVKVEGPVEVEHVTKWEDAGLHPVMLDNVTRLCKYEKMTPVQAYCIPAILNANDVVAIAQTGSGKTAAYLVPIISRLMGQAAKLAAPRPNPATYDPVTDRVRAEPLVVIIVPARELAAQIFDDARRLCYRSMLRPCVVYGGGPPRDQLAELQKGCDILIGTPGRLADFMDRPNVLSMSRVKFTVIDEADELMNGDWEEDIQKILGGGDVNEDADHLYFMFSATFPKEARRLAKEYMSEDYARIRVGRIGSSHNNIVQRVYNIDESMKDKALYELITSSPPARTIVFVNSKRKAEMVDDFLFNKLLPCTSIHSDRTQREREDAIRSFRNGTSPILVATGVMARGLDVNNIAHVINYDMPSAAHGGIQEYVHRIGRTARIGHKGMATTFFTERDSDLEDDLAKLLTEHGQEVPDFLDHAKPAEGEEIDWDDKSDEEDAPGSDAGDDANGFTPVGDDDANGFTPVGGEEEPAAWAPAGEEEDNKGW